MSRRHYLMSIVNNERYEENIFNYVYYNLITNGKNKGKAKLGKIEGNGVIENQLLAETTVVDRDITTSISNGIWTSNGTSSDNFFKFSYSSSFTEFVGHHYFFACDILQNTYNIDLRVGFFNDNMVGNIVKTGLTYGFRTAGNSATGIGLKGFTTGDIVDIRFRGWLIDLTLMFGTGNEPTSISDNRIQKIINEGYIEHNTGTYKASEVSEIEFDGFNLWDEQWELGRIDITDGSLVVDTERIRSKNCFNVVGGRTYYVKSPYTISLFYYDKNDEYLGYENASNETFTVASNCAKIRFFVSTNYGTIYNYDICINVSGTRNGTYVPYLSPLKPKYFVPNKVNDISDSFVGNENGNYFTRRIWFVDLGTLSWSKKSNNRFASGNELQNIIKTWTDYHGIPNLKCSKYSLTTPANIESSTPNDKTISMSGNGISVVIYDSDYASSDATTFKNAMSGVILFYELATPTVITMPVNHLARVDLGSLDYTLDDYRFYTTGIANLIKIEQGTLNLYCNKFIAVSSLANLTQNNNSMFLSSAGNMSFSRGQFTDAISFKNAMQGVYLWYETTDAVDESDVLETTTKIKLPQPLVLDGAMSIHNTFEVKATEYEFVRNVWKVDLGTLSWVDNSSLASNLFRGSVSGMNTTTVGTLRNQGILSTKYPASSSTGLNSNMNDKSMLRYEGSIFIRDSSYNDTTSFTTAMSGVYLYYELATPQTIRIPKKHLGVVDLGTKTYFITNASLGIVGTTGLQSSIKASTTNMYCSNFTNANVYSSNESIFVESNSAVDIRSSAFINKTANEVKTLLSGTYLFYETQSEVADFTNKAIFEKGGTVNAFGEKYTEVEYIESDGNQYIDTGINYQAKFVMDIKFNASSNRELVGYSTNAGNYFEKDANDLYGLGGGITSNTSVLNRQTIEFSLSGTTTTLKLPNETITRENISFSYGTFKLFWVNDVNYKGNGSVLYSAKVYDNGTCVRNFVPAIRQRDNVIGLYDKVNGKFFTNKGTGTFVAGNSIGEFDSNEALCNLIIKLQK